MNRLSRVEDGRLGQIGEAMERRDRADRSRRCGRTAAEPRAPGNRATRRASRPALRSRSTGPSLPRRRKPARSSGAARAARRPADSCSASCSQPRNAAVVQAAGLRLGEHREQRIDARLDRALAQQLGAEPVNGVDVRFFERLERVLEARRARRRRWRSARSCSSRSRSRSFSSPAAFSVKVTATISIHRRPSRGQHPEDAVHQLGRLAGAGRRLDHQRVVEILRQSSPRGRRHRRRRHRRRSSHRPQRLEVREAVRRLALDALFFARARRPDGSRTRCRRARRARRRGTPARPRGR